jgi:hypothetical protein
VPDTGLVGLQQASVPASPRKARIDEARVRRPGFSIVTPYVGLVSERLAAGNWRERSMTDASAFGALLHLHRRRLGLDTPEAGEEGRIQRRAHHEDRGGRSETGRGIGWSCSCAYYVSRERTVQTLTVARLARTVVTTAGSSAEARILAVYVARFLTGKPAALQHPRHRSPEAMFSRQLLRKPTRSPSQPTRW